jgi:hypothetical protein
LFGICEFVAAPFAMPFRHPSALPRRNAGFYSCFVFGGFAPLFFQFALD